MYFKNKTFKVDEGRQRIYVIFLVIIVSLLMFYNVKELVQTQKVLRQYDEVPKISSVESIDTDEIIRVNAYQNDRRNFNLTVIVIFGILAVFAYFFYLIFIKDVKLTIEHDGFRVYSRNSSIPSVEILWENVKSIQYGFMYVKESRIEQYRMKVIFKSKADNKWLNKYINIRRFNNDDEIIKSIEMISEMKDFDVFHLNE